MVRTTARVGIQRHNFYSLHFGDDFHILLNKTAAINIDILKYKIKELCPHIRIGIININLNEMTVSFSGTKIIDNIWIATEYCSEGNIINLKCSKEEVYSILESFCHMFEKI
jgi:hypothetical protein